MNFWFWGRDQSNRRNKFVRITIDFCGFQFVWNIDAGFMSCYSIFGCSLFFLLSFVRSFIQFDLNFHKCLTLPKWLKPVNASDLWKLNNAARTPGANWCRSETARERKWLNSVYLRIISTCTFNDRHARCFQFIKHTFLLLSFFRG